jgi:hypothetical protein
MSDVLSISFIVIIRANCARLLILRKLLKIRTHDPREAHKKQIGCTRHVHGSLANHRRSPRTRNIRYRHPIFGVAMSICPSCEMRTVAGAV